MTVRVAVAVAGTIADDAARRAPAEACGFLAGDGGGLIVGAVPTPNMSPHRGGFLIDPADHHEALLDIEGRGQLIVGVYHSHPAGPADPSETDLAAPLDSEWVSMVASPDGPRWVVRAFAIRDGQSNPLTIDWE